MLKVIRQNLMLSNLSLPYTNYSQVITFVSRTNSVRIKKCFLFTQVEIIDTDTIWGIYVTFYYAYPQRKFAISILFALQKSNLFKNMTMAANKTSGCLDH